MKIKAYTPYINGVLGHDFNLTFWQKIKIMFSKKLSVILLSSEFENKKGNSNGN